MARSYNQQQQTQSQHEKKVPADSIKSQGDRSLEEMSIHDQLMFLHDDATDDPKMEEYRSFLLAEIKAMTTGGEVPMSRSLSESDLSELCGASVKAPSPVDLLRAFTPPSGDERVHNQTTATGEERRTTATTAALNDPGGPRQQQQLAQPPPPVLPPKRRKHLGGGGGGGTQQQLQQNNLEELQHPTKAGKVYVSIYVRMYVYVCI